MKRLFAALLLTALSPLTWALDAADQQRLTDIQKIGRASCRERVS